MTTLNPTYASIVSGFPFVGIGPESRNICRLTKQAFQPLLEQNHVEVVINDLYELLEEARAGEHKAQLDDATFLTAKCFLLAFPKTLPSPELSLDSDGEISFDWIGKQNQILSVSLRRDGRLSIAGKLGVKRSFNETDQFKDGVPERILDSVKEIFSN
jgi:hypothetical protein